MFALTSAISLSVLFLGMMLAQIVLTSSTQICLYYVHNNLILFIEVQLEIC
jgi:hypothetical protein